MNAGRLSDLHPRVIPSIMGYAPVADAGSGLECRSGFSSASRRRKYSASFSIFLTPGSSIDPSFSGSIAIFSIVRLEMSVSSATVRQSPLHFCNCARTYSSMDSAIAAESIPNLGYSQPSYETNCLLSSSDMAAKKEGKRGTRPPSTAAIRLRNLLADNLSRLINERYPIARYSGKAEQEKAFAKDAGVSWSTVQRALDPEKGKTIDILADLASGLEIPIIELLSRQLPSQPNEDGPFKKPPAETTVRAKSA